MIPFGATTERPSQSPVPPALVLHTQGSGLTAVLAREIVSIGLRYSIAADATCVDARAAVDVIVLERDSIDAQAVIDDTRRRFPSTHIVSMVRVNDVVILHAFARLPRSVDLERLRTIAAAVRRATERGERR